ncbi:MAG: molybdate ABC transporter substrate-binding protein [Pseudomonadota bacterium]|nr:molybdate ABC transporter substrate-binding protein [Pseudomonadota bacterium]
MPMAHAPSIITHLKPTHWPCARWRRHAGWFARVLFIYCGLVVVTADALAEMTDNAPSVVSDLTAHNQEADLTLKERVALRVAVASNFAPTLKALAPAFEAESGHRLHISAASSAKLFAQIQNGAPFDVFLSADTELPQRLIAGQRRDGLFSSELSSEPNNELNSAPQAYAYGRLALWCRPACPDTLNGISQLLNSAPGVAVANPRLAPYGRATQEVLTALKATPPRLITGENIGQVYRFIESGNVQTGFVAWSQVILGQLPDDEVWLVPANFHRPIIQAAVLTPQCRYPQAGHALLEFLRNASAQITLQGYDAPYE